MICCEKKYDAKTPFSPYQKCHTQKWNEVHDGFEILSLREID